MSVLQALTRRRFLLGAAGSALARALVRGESALAAGIRSGPPRAVDFTLGVARGNLTRDAEGRLVSPVLTAPGRFDLAGARWGSGPEHNDVELRGRRRGGAWSPWTTAPLLNGHAPDGRREAPAGTDGVWFGGADRVQIRLRAPVGGLRLAFVNATGTATLAARRATRARRARAAAASVPTIAPDGAPPIIPRRVWDPHGQCRPRVRAETGAVELAFVHHTVSANTYGPSDTAAIVLSIGLYHRNTNGWNDIGYNFLVDRYGQIFEGRAGGVTRAVVGAQAQGFNSASTGVANIGTFDAEGQTERGLSALVRLIAWKLARHGTPAAGMVTVVSQGGVFNRFRAGTPVRLHRVSGHRDVDATDCPGQDLYGQLGELRARVESRALVTQPPTSITLAGPAAAVRYGGDALLTGRVLLDRRPPPAGSVVVIGSAGAIAAAPLAAARTRPDGTWSARVSLSAGAALRAGFEPGPGAAPLRSEIVRVAVAPRLTLTAARTRLRTGRSAALTFRARPAVGSLRLVLQRRAHGRWRTVLAQPLRPRARRARVTLPLPGAYRARLEWAGSAELARADSPWLALRAGGPGPGGAGT